MPIFDEANLALAPLTQDHALPPTSCIVMIKDATPHQKTKDDGTISHSWKLELEVLTPEAVEIRNEKFQFSGTQLTAYVALNAKSAGAVHGIQKLLAAIPEYSLFFNTDEPFQVKDKSKAVVDIPFRGKQVRAVLKTVAQQKQAKGELTQEDILKGVKDKWVNVFEAGKPVMNNRLVLDSWLGPVAQ